MTETPLVPTSCTFGSNSGQASLLSTEVPSDGHLWRKKSEWSRPQHEHDRRGMDDHSQSNDADGSSSDKDPLHDYEEDESSDEEELSYLEDSF